MPHAIARTDRRSGVRSAPAARPARTAPAARRRIPRHERLQRLQCPGLGFAEPHDPRLRPRSPTCTPARTLASPGRRRIPPAPARGGAADRASSGPRCPDSSSQACARITPAGIDATSGVSSSVTRRGSPPRSRYSASVSRRWPRSGEPAGVRRRACSASWIASPRAPRRNAPSAAAATVAASSASGRSVASARCSARNSSSPTAPASAR